MNHFNRKHSGTGTINWMQRHYTLQEVLTFSMSWFLGDKERERGRGGIGRDLRGETDLQGEEWLY